MMELTEILNEIRERGLRAVIRGGNLFIGPGDKVRDELRDALKDNMAGLLAHFACGGDEAVEWRAAKMLTHLLPLCWPCSVPCLFACLDVEPGETDCKSCGELLATGEGDSFICGECSRAKDIALTIWMQRPVQSMRAA